VTPRPKLVVKAMKTWQAAVLRVIGWMIGIRGEAKISYIIFDNDKEEPTINDIVKNNEEDAMNRVSTQTTNRMESGE
jgi:hypothetical protein